MPLAAVEAGDFRFELQHRSDETLRCTKELLNSWHIEEVDDWSQLPEQVRKVFSQVAKNDSLFEKAFKAEQQRQFGTRDPREARA